MEKLNGEMMNKLSLAYFDGCIIAGKRADHVDRIEALKEWRHYLTSIFDKIEIKMTWKRWIMCASNDKRMPIDFQLAAYYTRFVANETENLEA